MQAEEEKKPEWQEREELDKALDKEPAKISAR
jgi:hypothetical protein